MRSLVRVSGLVLLAWVPALAATGQQWPSFRGDRAAGNGDGENPPVAWNAEEGTNVLWRVALPGLGHSSPVIWGERLFLTSASSPDHEPFLKPGLYGESPDNPEDWTHEYKVHCLDKRSGQIIWERTAIAAKPRVRRHVKSSHATPTPATDGKRLVVSFGSEGLFAFDYDGNPLWSVDLGLLDSGAFNAPEIQWGYGSSPVIHGDRVFVLCDVNNQSFLAAFDADSGKELWRTLRDEVPTWGTPTIHEAADRQQVIVNGYKHRGGYDLATGEELWRMSGGGDIPVPTPVVAHGLAFFSSAHGPQRPVLAVRLDAEGDVTLSEGETSNEHVAWSVPSRAAYLPTPIVYGDLLYVGNDRGILTAYQARSGEQVYRVRLGGSRGAYSASPVAADGRLYFTNEDCDTHVVEAGAEYRLLGTNHVPGVCLATPAISEGMVLIRSSRHVWALGRTGERRVFADEEEAPPAAAEAPAAADVGVPVPGPADEAVVILERADAAAKAVQTARYTVDVQPSGAAAERIPAVEARIVAEGWLQGLPERFRVAVASSAGDGQGAEIVAGSDGNVYYVIDPAASTVYEDLEASVVGSHRQAIFTALVVEFHNPQPFAQEIGSPVRELQGEVEVEGEECYQVRVVYDEEGSYETAWFFSKEDLLPRRRSDSFPMGEGQRGGIVRTIRDLVVGNEASAEDFALVVPEGYVKKNEAAP